MDEADASDFVWCMRVLRHVCLGLWQIHRLDIAHQDLKPSIVLRYRLDTAHQDLKPSNVLRYRLDTAHQDLKPSNVLRFRNDDIRVADLGRCSILGRPMWHDEVNFPGDRTYAPPELLYGYVHPDFTVRRMGTDFYMLGNLAVFLFTGTNVTESLMARLDPQHHWTNWPSDYASVLSHVQEAFGRVLEELETCLPDEVRAEVMQLVRQMCNPDLSLRGHPKGIGKPDQYSLERFVSRLTHMVTTVEIKARVARRSA